MANKWEMCKKVTCLIETCDSDGNVYIGTGFFYGQGWVMSVAHNFQNDNRDPKQLHSLLSEARFRFVVDGQSFYFPPQPPQNPIRRTAFIHHLQPGENIDPNNKDIAMVKLGKQYKYGDRKEYQDWETVEDIQLKRMQLQSVLATIHDQQAAPNDTVHAIYYAGEEPNNRKTQTLNATNVEQNPNNPIMELQPTLQPGASGCPIINENFNLVGLFVGGGEYGNPQARDEALMWNGGIQEFISEGVSIIAGIEGYMANRNAAIIQPQADLRQRLEEYAENERLLLEQRATNARLTIYLMNGVVINGPEANNN